MRLGLGICGDHQEVLKVLLMDHVQACLEKFS